MLVSGMVETEEGGTEEDKEPLRASAVAVV